MDDLITLGLGFAFFIASYFIGTRAEKKHFAQIVQREKELFTMPAVTFKTPEDRPVARSKLVTGNVVIAGDFFKQTVASLGSIFGMRIAVAETMVDRGRREALLRMKEQAPDADIILNVRVQSMKIGDRRKMTGLETMAYGTAVYYVK
jgi:uncharacterized protein YbjQ (UPF0145 family)